MSSYIAQALKLRSVIEKAVLSLDDAMASEAPTLFPSMRYDENLIKAGTRICWNGMVKRAAVDLWDAERNDPDNAPALWEDIAFKDGWRYIPETITAGTAFALGECGWWEDLLYKSLINANVYTPVQYPAGWEVCE